MNIADASLIIISDVHCYATLRGLEMSEIEFFDVLHSLIPEFGMLKHFKNTPKGPIQRVRYRKAKFYKDFFNKIINGETDFSDCTKNIPEDKKIYLRTSIYHFFSTYFEKEFDALPFEILVDTIEGLIAVGLIRRDDMNLLTIFIEGFMRKNQGTKALCVIDQFNSKKISSSHDLFLTVMLNLKLPNETYRKIFVKLLWKLHSIFNMESKIDYQILQDIGIEYITIEDDWMNVKWTGDEFKYSISKHDFEVMSIKSGVIVHDETLRYEGYYDDDDF